MGPVPLWASEQEGNHQKRVIDQRSSQPRQLLTWTKSSHGFASELPPHLYGLTCADGLAFGCYDNNILVQLNAIFIPEDTRQHNLCSVTDGVHLERTSTQSQVLVFVGVTMETRRLTALSFITKRLWDTSSFSRGKMTLRRYDSSLLWSNCHWASRTSCIVTMLSWKRHQQPWGGIMWAALRLQQ